MLIQETARNRGAGPAGREVDEPGLRVRGRILGAGGRSGPTGWNQRTIGGSSVEPGDDQAAVELAGSASLVGVGDVGAGGDQRGHRVVDDVEAAAVALGGLPLAAGRR